MLTLDTIREAPKALLHDHLDGGLRPPTIIELAREFGYAGAADRRTPDELAAWFRRGADRKSPGAVPRDVRAHGRRHAGPATPSTASPPSAPRTWPPTASSTPRSASRPSSHVERGLTLDEVVEAVLEGSAPGRQRAAAAGHPITVRALVTAMRQAARSMEIAELAVRYRDAGVVGFDIAGPEAGYPPTRHLDAFEHVRGENFHITIHAGEAFGLPSIWEALQLCGAERLGHGVRIIDDITVAPDGPVSSRAAGRLRPRPPRPAGDVPDVQRPHRAAPPRSPSTPSTSSAGCGSG